MIASVRHTARDAIAPLQGLVESVFDSVANVFDGVTKVDSLEEENAQLRSRLSTLEGKLSLERGVGEEYSQLGGLAPHPRHRGCHRGGGVCDRWPVGELRANVDAVQGHEPGDRHRNADRRGRRLGGQDHRRVVHACPR